MREFSRFLVPAHRPQAFLPPRLFQLKIARAQVHSLCRSQEVDEGINGPRRWQKLVACRGSRGQEHGSLKEAIAAGILAKHPLPGGNHISLFAVPVITVDKQIKGAYWFHGVVTYLTMRPSKMPHPSSCGKSYLTPFFHRAEEARVLGTRTDCHWR